MDASSATERNACTAPPPFNSCASALIYTEELTVSQTYIVRRQLYTVTIFPSVEHRAFWSLLRYIFHTNIYPIPCNLAVSNCGGMAPKGLDAYSASYMLLPNFNFFPGGLIQLGTIMPTIHSGDLPDPKRPLNSTFRVPIAPSQFDTKQEYSPWAFDSRKSTKNLTALQASISLLTGVGGHLSGDKTKARELMIDCENVQVESFRPDKAYLAKAVDDEMLQTLARRLPRRPLYMVTGLMVAKTAVIRVSDEHGRAFGAGVEGDFTSQGVPLNTGFDVEHTRSGKATMVSVPTQPFILAYQIVRLRKKGGAVVDTDIDRWALFADEQQLDTLGDWDVDWVPGGLPLETQTQEEEEENEKALPI
jgi:hypothetical protein